MSFALFLLNILYIWGALANAPIVPNIVAKIPSIVVIFLLLIYFPYSNKSWKSAMDL